MNSDSFEFECFYADGLCTVRQQHSMVHLLYFIVHELANWGKPLSSTLVIS